MEKGVFVWLDRSTMKANAENCAGTLFERFEMTFAVVLNHLHHAFVIKGRKREGKLKVPEIAFREIFSNAVIPTRDW